jgi:hypothetical protein
MLFGLQEWTERMNEWRKPKRTRHGEINGESQVEDEEHQGNKAELTTKKMTVNKNQQEVQDVNQDTTSSSQVAIYRNEYQ